MKRLLPIILLFIFLAPLKGAAQQPVINYINSLMESGNRAVTQCTFSENRDPKNGKLKMRYLRFEVKDVAIVKELRKLLFKERDKATRIHLDDSQREISYFALFKDSNNTQVTVVVYGTVRGWEITLREVFNAKDGACVPEDLKVEGKILISLISQSSQSTLSALILFHRPGAIA